MDTRTACEQTFATPELLEHILTYLLDDLHRIRYGKDPRSPRTYANADSLVRLLHCSEINNVWRQCFRGSKRLQRALFLAPDQKRGRSWDLDLTLQPASGVRPHCGHVAPSLHAPVLNPIIQTIFKTYHFRYWHLSLEASGDKYCAYLIITRRDMPDLLIRARTGRGRTISRMLLSQPPCTALEATIWEERDETKDYVGRTAALSEPRVDCEEGLTLGIVHEKVGEMFRQHSDVAAIKLTTV